MNNARTRHQRRASNTPRREAGVALFVAIIALLLVTAVAAGMIILSNSEINIDANYRDEQVALYAAKAGLQEGRDRALAGTNQIALPQFLPVPGAAGSFATYIIATGISPSTGSLATNPYYDTEFANEYNGTSTLPSGTGWYTTAATNTSYSGPAANPVPYKWVRMNLKVDRSAYTTLTPYYVDGNSANAGNQVYYDWTNLHECVSGVGTCVGNSNLQPVYEITSYAVTPSGTRRTVQDEVTAQTFNLNFPSALTIPGTTGTFASANSNPYHVNGNDGSGNAPAIAGCTPNAPAVSAIGVSSGNDAAGTLTNLQNVENGLPRPGNYTGSCGSSPCVSNVALNSTLSSPANLNQSLQLIKQSANPLLQPSPPPANGVSTANYGWSDITNAMGGSWSNSSDNPQVVYVDGNFDLGPNTGSGVLVVTGNFTYHGNSGWNGIILVVGDGTTTFDGLGGGNGQFDGALFVATTRDANGNQLSNFGTANFDISGGGGNGIYYNSCWIKNVQQPVSYQLLSSKEISH